MLWAHRIRVQQVREGSEPLFEVRISRVSIGQDVRFDETPGIPSGKARFARDKLHSLLSEAFDSDREASAVLTEAALGHYAERCLPIIADVTVVDRLSGGVLLRSAQSTRVL